MKHILALLLFLLVIKGLSQESLEYNYVMPGSETCLIEKNNSSVKILSHEKYQIILQRTWACGEIITIINREWKDTLISIKWGPIYFFGIYHDYLFFDKGTGSMRVLVVYNLKKEDFEFSTAYEIVPMVKNDSVFYQYPLQESKELPQDLPECSDDILKLRSIGYREERIYVLPKRQNIKTGIIKCEYRE